MTCTVLGVAALGPLLAPYGGTEPVGGAFAAPQAGMWLGTDHLGRDVLSRVLTGGTSMLLLSAAALSLAYLIGGGLGLIAALGRGLLDAVLIRPLDVLIALPPFLVLAVLATGTGRGTLVVIVAAAVANIPSVARVVRAAAWEVSVRGWVEAAVARGERRVTIARREVLPHIATPLLADIGVRATAVIGLVGTANFLGLGLQPPLADWALMIAENRSGLMLQPWAVLVPAGCIAVLAIGINVTADAVVHARSRHA
ncbi:ABC transporter permease [Streptomyces halobius]|uniref:ABC transporter permease n=1 Tax=Streptomyces halobius TaxID=2879846 RepID=A0ABY4LZ03_9ACTN|nr:ABC transporter permease [Streptomyces halobius]UQA90698.1 ABC transporter permease [Streptomyces halobius]